MDSGQLEKALATLTGSNPDCTGVLLGCDLDSALPKRGMAINLPLIFATLVAVPCLAVAQPASCPQFSPGRHLLSC